MITRKMRFIPSSLVLFGGESETTSTVILLLPSTRMCQQRKFRLHAIVLFTSNAEVVFTETSGEKQKFQPQPMLALNLKNLHVH